MYLLHAKLADGNVALTPDPGSAHVVGHGGVENEAGERDGQR